jgi:hydrogenase maturation factor
MDKTIFSLTGARTNEALSGPRPGVDTTVLKIAQGKVLIASTDPVSFIPALGAKESAWLSVHATASDVAASGMPPRYAMFDLNLPPNLTDSVLRNYWTGIHESCRELGISIVGGHTGRFEGCGYTVVGGVTMFAIGDQGKYVTSAMAGNGDDLIATKSAAIEATTVLARAFPKTLEVALGRSNLAKARQLLHQVSVVKDALTAASVGLKMGGVTAMHDVTEGGILSAVLELADASGLKALVFSDSILVYNEVRKTCEFFHMDPLVSLGQGSLVIASRPHKTTRVMKALKTQGIRSKVIGRLTRNRAHSIVARGKFRRLDYPKDDPYWRAYWGGVAKNLS